MKAFDNAASEDAPVRRRISGMTVKTPSNFEQVFARLGKELSATTNAVTAAEIILNAANELIGWDACYLVLYDPQRGGKPRPLLTIDTTASGQIVQHNAAPDAPSENMLRAIREGGFLSLYDENFSLPPRLRFGDLSNITLSQLFVPVRNDRRTIGVLSIQSYRKNAYSEASLETLKTLANHCAGALERIWAQEALEQMAERLRGLHQAAHAINASLDMEALCDAIHRTVENVMPCNDFVIDGYDPETNEIVPIYAIEYPRKRVQTERYLADHGLAGHIVHTKKSLLLNSLEEMTNSGIDFEFYGSEEDQTQSIAAAPLTLKGRVIGMISAQSYQPNAYTEDDLHLLELLASHAAIAIENARLFAAVQKLADTDPLTECLNRRKFFEVAEQAFQHARQERRPLSVILLDVDEFKRFNDRFGHAVGDRALKMAAGQCKAALREGDIFGRLGGEEFAALLPNTPLSQAEQIAKRLHRAVEAGQIEGADQIRDLVSGARPSKEALKVTVSVGVAELNQSCYSIDALIELADRAMYAGKYAGKNQINIWNDREV